MPAAAEQGARAFGRSASSRIALDEVRPLYTRLGLDEDRPPLRDARSPSTSTISSASTSWYDSHRLPPRSPPPPPQSKPPRVPNQRPQSKRPLFKSPSLHHPLTKSPSLQHPPVKSPSLQQSIAKSPSLQHAPHGRPVPLPRQRALVKSPSLPVPSRLIDSTPLPMAKSSLPTVQVFLSRPKTPRSVTGPQAVAPRPPLPPLPPSRFADAEPEPPRQTIRRVSSARAATPSPAFWKTSSTAFDAMQGESILGPRTDVSDARAPGSSGDFSAIIDSDFESSLRLSVASEPGSTSNVADFGNESPTGILASLRNLNFHIARSPDPWNVPAARAPTPRLVDRITGSGNPYAVAQRRGPGERRMAPRVFSFDPIRTKASRHRRLVDDTERSVMQAQDIDDVEKSMSLYCDDYVGFMGVVPSKKELIKVRSRRWMGRLLRRREDRK